MTNPTNGKLPVALDAMGGDDGIVPNVKGAIDALVEYDLRSILVGDEELLKAEIERNGATKHLSDGRLSIVHAESAVAMDEKPASALRNKKDSSMRKVCDLVSEGKASAALSAGNSGAMLAIALFALKRVQGISRPCIGISYPARDNKICILVDGGANTECTPEQLCQFGIMGAAYARTILSIDRPKVAVLSNGTEDTKGTDLTRAARDLLANQTDVNFHGYIEGTGLTAGDVRVVVTDGFTGNIVLKTAEGTASFVSSEIKRAFGDASIIGRLGGLLAKKVFETMRSRNDPRKWGAAPLLGLRKPALVAHGSSDAYAIQQGIRIADQYGNGTVISEIESTISRSAAAA